LEVRFFRDSFGVYFCCLVLFHGLVQRIWLFFFYEPPINEDRARKPFGGNPIGTPIALVFLVQFVFFCLAGEIAEKFYLFFPVAREGYALFLSPFILSPPRVPCRRLLFDEDLLHRNPGGINFPFLLPPCAGGEGFFTPEVPSVIAENFPGAPRSYRFRGRRESLFFLASAETWFMKGLPLVARPVSDPYKRGAPRFFCWRPAVAVANISI